MGAAYLAGLGVGIWQIEDLQLKWKIDKSFKPSMSKEDADKHNALWLKAVDRAKNWIE